MPVLVAGEALVDLVRATAAPAPSLPGFVAHPGGGPFTTAVALARLGVPTRLLARIAQDPLGRLLRARAEAAGVDLGAVVPAAEPTSLALADVDAAGHAAYSFYLAGTSALGWQPGELPAAQGRDVSAVHTGSLALAVEPAGAELAEAVVDWAGAGAALSLDPNVRPGSSSDDARLRTRLLALAAAADVVRASDEDLSWLAPGERPEDTARALQRSGACLVVLTRGDGDVQAWWDDGSTAVRARVVEVADTVGAGDTVVAALLAVLHEADALRPGLPGLDGGLAARALRTAVATAAVSVGRPGAAPPWRDELDRAAADGGSSTPGGRGAA